MNDPGLDPGTAERMLRGEPTGPPRLAALLTATASGLTGEDPEGQEAAVTAFREARLARTERPRARRLAALVSLKAALIGLLLVLAGGAAVAATTPHLAAPRHAHGIRTPHPGVPRR